MIRNHCPIVCLESLLIALALLSFLYSLYYNLLLFLYKYILSIFTPFKKQAASPQSAFLMPSVEIRFSEEWFQVHQCLPMDFVDVRLCEIHLLRNVSPAFALDIPSPENCPPDSVFFLAYEFFALIPLFDKLQISLVHLGMVGLQFFHDFLQIGTMTALYLFTHLYASKVMRLKLQTPELFLQGKVIGLLLTDRVQKTLQLLYVSPHYFLLLNYRCLPFTRNRLMVNTVTILPTNVPKINHAASITAPPSWLSPLIALSCRLPPEAASYFLLTCLASSSVMLV
nr:MAG TPA: hypothetical protein [Caudoviricetes sp.]